MIITERRIYLARAVIDGVKKDKTTIVVSKLLLDRVGVHVRKNEDNQTSFLTRAIVNQLEREGDIEIRSMLKEESGGEENW